MQEYVVDAIQLLMGFSSLSAAAGLGLPAAVILPPPRRNRRKPTFHCTHCSKSLQLKMALSRQLMLNIVDTYISQHRFSVVKLTADHCLFIVVTTSVLNWSLHKDEQLSYLSVHSSFMYIHTPFLRLLCTPYT